ncbi:MAG: molybdopterin guanine dinucleotide-containing S/N-oxide reductase [Phenylobacterium sp.]|uniref:molybdopterin guanine dinucleotide-containing S/N-oxide reductase n=1 Tax=Phenylobacterium sp. TaxID=1871053 RepID=UPI0027357339|nr:molybdopterin guanine dinucleotide-containing S/N-oxide reductase [Phenylobacterium sp.]MDP3747667.1 molybdopterin guanine dinucleotide-containing S/N-oxide reductase [Phenylobacterium sp.]
MSARTYSAAHWGLYEVEAGARGQRPTLHPWSLDPDPSPIGLDQLEPEVQRLRVTRPAVRRSWLEQGPGAAPRTRGCEAFVEVDWDVALDLVAAELRRVRAAFGNTAVFGGSYGWSSAGRFHHAQSQVHRFLNQWGGYVRHVDTYSLGAGRALMPYIAASMDESNASHTSWSVLAEHTELFVGFGGVPVKNGQVSPGGPGRHRLAEGLQRMARAGVRFVNISPVRDNLVTGGEVEWIPIRPNTDTALMLGLAYAIQQDNRFDRGFIDRCTAGFDRFLPYLLGDTDGVPKTPEWAAEITGVPADRIGCLAREMLSARTMINAAWALQRAAHGEQPFWMLVALSSMVGQVGLPGGGYGLGYGAANTMGSSHVHMPGPVFPQGQNPIPDFIPVARIADMLLKPGESFTYQGGVYRYPEIRLVYWAGGNPFHHHQDLNRLTDAWSRPETIVVHEQYWTPTARFADIVLPATTSLERDDIGFAGREGYILAMRKAVEPFGEARDDYRIFADLAARLGVADSFTEGLDAPGWLRRIYAENLPRARAVGIDLPDFDAFWAQGVVDLAGHDRPIVMHEAFRTDPDGNRLRTPSGKIEIYSETIAGFGLPDCPGHPVWLEPFEWLGHEKAKAYPLHLLSDQPRRRLHSQLDHSPYSRAGKVAGREPIYLNPADAAARGIADGDLVEVFNDRGRCLAGAIVSDDIMTGVIRLATGGWYDPAPDGLDRNANPNSLTLDRGTSSFAQGCSAQTCLADVRRFDGVAPPIAAYESPQIEIQD